MNILDIIILICFIPSLVQGLRKGFIAQVIAILSILAGVYLSFEFSNAAGTWLGQYIEGSEQVLKITAFALILIGAIAAFTALGRLLEGVVNIVMLGWVNKLLGVAFSFLKCALVIGLIIMAFNSLNNSFHIISEEELAKSILYPPLKDIAYTVFPYLKDLLFWK